MSNPGPTVTKGEGVRAAEWPQEDGSAVKSVPAVGGRRLRASDRGPLTTGTRTRFAVASPGALLGAVFSALTELRSPTWRPVTQDGEV
jgi:hypothetical protein